MTKTNALFALILSATLPFAKAQDISPNIEKTLADLTPTIQKLCDIVVAEVERADYAFPAGDRSGARYSFSLSFNSNNELLNRVLKEMLTRSYTTNMSKDDVIDFLRNSCMADATARIKSLIEEDWESRRQRVEATNKKLPSIKATEEDRADPAEAARVQRAIDALGERYNPSAR